MSLTGRCTPGSCGCRCEYKPWWKFKCRAGKHCKKHNKGCHIGCT